jgi:hypothetical protein
MFVTSQPPSGVWPKVLKRPAVTAVHPICRFVWGKSWNIPGIVWSIAERLEYFTKDGMPRRSFLRLLFRRVLEDQHPESLGSSSQHKVSGLTQGFQEYGKETESHEVLSGERPDQIGYSFYDDPAMGRAVMHVQQHR